jgi:hypothetical protein
MRHARWALLALLTFVPQARAQRMDDDAQRRVGRLMDRLRDEMFSYRQELEFFRRAPEYDDLLNLRYNLRNLAVWVADPEHRDFSGQRRAARQMEQAARELYAKTAQLEQRINLGSPEEVHRRADALEEHAVEIRVLVGRLYELDRVDDDRPDRPRFSGESGRWGGRPGATEGRPGPAGRSRDPRDVR